MIPLLAEGLVYKRFKEAHQRKDIFGTPIRVTWLSKNSYSQCPNQEDEKPLKPMNITFDFQVRYRRQVHGHRILCWGLANRLVFMLI